MPCCINHAVEQYECFGLASYALFESSFGERVGDRCRLDKIRNHPAERQQLARRQNESALYKNYVSTIVPIDLRVWNGTTKRNTNTATA
jgi:hypothetical protein